MTKEPAIGDGPQGSGRRLHDRLIRGCVVCAVHTLTVRKSGDPQVRDRSPARILPILDCLHIGRQLAHAANRRGGPLPREFFTSRLISF